MNAHHVHRQSVAEIELGKEYEPCFSKHRQTEERHGGPEGDQEDSCLVQDPQVLRCFTSCPRGKTT